MSDLDALLAAFDVAPPSMTGAQGRLAKPTPDPDRQRRNRKNRNRGKNTSRDLAQYLGPQWQNVEGMLWSWDVQSAACRIQSKRELRTYGPVAALTIIDAIPAGDYLRGLFHVSPSRRLTSGELTFRLQEWVAEYGWAMPMSARLAIAGDQVLISMPLPTFADYGRGAG